MIDCKALAAQIALYSAPMTACTSLIQEYRGSPVSNTGLSEDRGLAGYQEGTVEKHISSILIKLNLQEADDDHRRVLAVITFLKAR